YLVYDNAVDSFCLDIGQEPLQPGPIHVAAAEAAVGIGLFDHGPTEFALAADVGLGCFTLRHQRVELLLQALFGRLANVNGAANLREILRPGHFAFSPMRKNAKPFQRVPATFEAIPLSDW